MPSPSSTKTRTPVRARFSSASVKRTGLVAWLCQNAPVRMAPARIRPPAAAEYTSSADARVPPKQTDAASRWPMPSMSGV